MLPFVRIKVIFLISVKGAIVTSPVDRKKPPACLGRGDIFGDSVYMGAILIRARVTAQQQKDPGLCVTGVKARLDAYVYASWRT